MENKEEAPSKRPVIRTIEKFLESLPGITFDAKIPLDGLTKLTGTFSIKLKRLKPKCDK